MIDPNGPEVGELIDGWLASEEERRGADGDFAVSLALRLFIVGLQELKQLVGPSTALTMATGLLEGYRRMNAHACDDPLCPLNIKSGTRQ